MKPKKPNKSLIKKIIAAVEKQPLRMQMQAFARLADDIAPCGTSACIAGFAVALSGKVKARTWAQVIRKLYPNTDFHQEARKLLRLNPDQAYALFYADNWPADLRVKWRIAEGREKESEVVVERLRHFLKFGS